MIRGLKYISLHEHSGYGTAAFRYLRGLVNAGVALTWTPMVPGGSWGKHLYYEPYLGQSIGDAVLDPICNRDIDYDTVVIHLVPEYYPRWRKLESGKRIIGYTTWETDRLPDHWPDILNRLDRIWVPSTWNREVFERSGVRIPIDVIPHILNTMPPTGSTTPHPLTDDIPQDHFVFYTINVWSARKAPWLLCDAFTTTFSSEEPISLVIKTSAYDLSSRFAKSRFPLRELARTRRSFRKRLKERCVLPSIMLIAEEGLSPAGIEALHRRGDCYVSLTRSEGWGLGAFDAVAARNPVIMTAYGGQTDFLNPDLAYLVDYQLVPVSDPMNAESYSPNQKWADPNIGHAGKRMREVYENFEEARKRGERLYENSRRHFSESVVIDKMLTNLNPYP